VLSVGGSTSSRPRASLSARRWLGICWRSAPCCAGTVYTSPPELARAPPAALVTGYTMAIGTALYVPFGVAVSARWTGARSASGLVRAPVFGVFALYVAYLSAHRRPADRQPQDVNLLEHAAGPGDGDRRDLAGREDLGLEGDRRSRHPVGVGITRIDAARAPRTAEE